MANYKIIGGDQREYGPVTIEELCQWITEGRANLDTLVQEEGSGHWQPMGSFPELAEVFRTRFPEQAARARAIIEGAANFEPDAPLDVGRCLRDGWSLLSRRFGSAIQAVLVVWLIETGLDLIPVLGGFVGFVVRGFLYGGLFRYFLGLIREEPVTVADVFRGNALQLMLAGIVTSLLVQIGNFLCILPGVFLMVAWRFTLALVADKELDFWAAMELSRKAVTPRWFQVFGLCVVIFLPTILCTAFIDYRLFSEFMRIWAEQKGLDLTHLERVVQVAVPLTFLYKIVWLVNLPWAVAPLMMAYEQLFGGRRAPRPEAGMDAGL